MSKQLKHNRRETLRSMHKVTITQENGGQTMTTMHIKHGAVVSTRIQTYKMPAPRKKPTEEDVRQARARWRYMLQERKWNGT